jgi:hypothetical protein
MANIDFSAPQSQISCGFTPHGGASVICGYDVQGYGHESMKLKDKVWMR